MKVHGPEDDYYYPGCDGCNEAPHVGVTLGAWLCWDCSEELLAVEALACALGDL